MLMRANDRRIEHDRCQVGSLQGAKDMLPNPRFGPTIEPLKHRIPVAVSLRQVAPRRAGPGNPNHRIDEPPVVLAVSTWIALPARQYGFDVIPFLVRQFVASAHSGILAKVKYLKRRTWNYPDTQKIAR